MKATLAVICALLSNLAQAEDRQQVYRASSFGVMADSAAAMGIYGSYTGGGAVGVFLSGSGTGKGKSESLPDEFGASWHAVSSRETCGKMSMHYGVAFRLHPNMTFGFGLNRVTKDERDIYYSSVSNTYWKGPKESMKDVHVGTMMCELGMHNGIALVLLHSRESSSVGIILRGAGYDLFKH